MDLKIADKHALVTGAGRGIGRAVAKCLAKEGVNVTAVARTNSDLATLKEEISDFTGKCSIISMDLMPEGAPGALIEQIISDDMGSLDIVVHNIGGTMNVIDPFCSIKEWRDLYRFNFEIALEINQLVLPTMRDKGWGRVVQNSSIAAMENQGPVSYCAIKAALTAYTRSMGGVMAPHGVVMSAVLPGAVYTEGGYWDSASRCTPGHVEKFLTERQRIGRFGRPEEIGNYITYLCSDLASFNTGSIVPVDGGQGRGYFGQ